MSVNYISAIIISNSLSNYEVIDAVYDGMGGYNLIKNGNRVGYIENDNNSKMLYSSLGLTFKLKTVAMINQYAKFEIVSSKFSKIFNSIKSIIASVKLSNQTLDLPPQKNAFKSAEISQVESRFPICDELNDAKMKNRLNRFYERTNS